MRVCAARLNLSDLVEEPGPEDLPAGETRQLLAGDGEVVFTVGHQQDPGQAEGGDDPANQQEAEGNPEENTLL